MTPPAIFCFDDNPSETLSFICDFREVRLRNLRYSERDRHRKRKHGGNWIGTYTDIAAIRRITPAAALVLAAEFDRAVRYTPASFGEHGIVNAHLWNPDVASMLTDLGFLKHLNASLPDLHQPEAGMTKARMLPMMSGKETVPSEIDGLKNDLVSLANSGIDHVLSHAIYNGLLEAMDNCAAHAYPDDHEFRHPADLGPGDNQVAIRVSRCCFRPSECRKGRKAGHGYRRIHS